MKYAAITERLAQLGGAKWDMHLRARALERAGEEVYSLTIGEPDAPMPPDLLEVAIDSLRRGRIGYSNGRGEPALVETLARRYATRTGRAITTGQILCLPGTQTVLYAIFMGLTDAGDEVLVGDPMYATYEGIIRASGAVPVPVPLDPENGFRIRAEDIAARITAKSRVIFLNSPHNPTGAVLTRDDLLAIGELARVHDLWIVSDEVYEELVFDGAEFVSPFDMAHLADRTVVAASISKSHAAPGFRSGWCVGPEEFCDRLLPVSETMLFGNQPFIADMTAAALALPSPIAPGMRARFAARAKLLHDRLHGFCGLRVSQPQAGMFALVDVSATGMTGDAFAPALLDATRVAVMPGGAFGPALEGWLRLSLTASDERFSTAVDRIADFAQKLDRERKTA
ncbi:MAG: aminotransferase class I/II-fold pyridoxal phosphate-dependent enzyme [Paracoccaceae bacterium]